MNKFLQFDHADRNLWLGILGIGGTAIILLSVFTAAPFLGYVGRFLISIFIMFLPGYAIVKMFLNDLKLSDYPILDRFLASFFFSIATVQTLYFLTTYLRTYGLNVDEDVIRSDKIAIAIAIFVLAAAFGVKYVLNRKAAAPAEPAP